MPRASDESEFDYDRRKAQIEARGGFIDDDVMPAINRLLQRIADLKRDRDEWKEQHENLLHIYRTTSAELVALKASLGRDSHV